MRFRLVMSEMFIGLRRNLTLTIAVIITVTVSLVMVGIALMINRQVDQMKGYWYDKVQVQVSLCTDTDAAAPCSNHPVTQGQKDAIQERLNNLPQVESVFYESREEAFQHFKEQFKDSPALIQNVTADTLPESYRVKLKNPKESDIVVASMVGRPGVASVIDQRKLFASGFRLLNTFQFIAVLAALGILAAATALIVNTVRIAVFSRRREISIMRLVGASNLYIELPFLLEGAFAGFIGGALSVVTVWLIEAFIVHGRLQPVIKFTPFIGWDDVVGISITLVVLGTVLSTIVAFFTLTLSRATRV